MKIKIVTKPCQRVARLSWHEELTTVWEGPTHE